MLEPLLQKKRQRTSRIRREGPPLASGTAHVGRGLSFPRLATILAGAGSLALLVLAALISWEEIMAQYHLLRLRNDSGYLHGVLEKPDGTPQRAAVRKYLESPEGKAALIKACLPEEGVKAVRWGSVFPTDMTSTPQVCLYVSLDYIRMAAGRTERFYATKREWYKLTHEYIPHGETFSLPEYPGEQLIFQKVSILEVPTNTRPPW